METVAEMQKLLLQNGFVVPNTSGSSMRPLLWGRHHRVVVVPLSGEPEVDDLLFFSYSTQAGVKNVVHRLVDVKDENGERIYITRGDNCLNCESVRRGDIIGRVAEVHRLSGFRPWHAIPQRKFAMTDRSYLRYSRVWAATWPARRLCYLLRAHVRGVCARLRSIYRK
ncbi:MAG: hypothetical protein K2L93_03820 [Muribaculaceae bacterium]|nr:hypothetical protein [Muribaculaceae bacterium]MDE6321406.1 hypothetical protein [Muribaculaceae bacterium]